MAIMVKKSSIKAVLRYIKFMSKTQDIRDEILLAALPNVAFDGWSWDMVCESAVQAGHTENVARAVFPSQLVDVLDHFADWADRQMLEALKDVDPEELRIRDRVRDAVLTRLTALTPHKEAVRQSLQCWAWPTRNPRAAKVTWRTADCIWQWAGDTATDYNRYTKRGLLSGVIASTTLAWLKDVSEDMEQTTAFLDRRIENVMQLGKVVNRFKTKVS